jgi:hypothetical protein
MSNPTSADIQGLTKAIRELVEEISDNSHHKLDALLGIEKMLEGIKDELNTVGRTLENIGFGGSNYPGPLEKMAMHLEKVVEAQLSSEIHLEALVDAQLEANAELRAANGESPKAGD